METRPGPFLKDNSRQSPEEDFVDNFEAYLLNASSLERAVPKALIAALEILVTGCASISRSLDTNTKTFSDFLKIPLGSPKELLKIWGPATSNESKAISKKNFSVWNYERTSGRKITEFSLDPSAQLLVEKIYLPEAIYKRII